MAEKMHKNGKLVDLRLAVPPELNDALRARARLLRRPYAEVLRDALAVYFGAKAKPFVPPPAILAVSGDIARLLQIAVYTANLVRALGRRLDGCDMSHLETLALLKLMELRHELVRIDAALGATRRQLADHLSELPVAQPIPRTSNTGDTVQRSKEEGSHE